MKFKIGDEVFMIKCETADTHKGLFKIIKFDVMGYVIVEYLDDPSDYTYFVLPQHLRYPIDDETTVRLYD